MKKSILYFILVIVILILSFLGYRNYKSNELIEESNSNATFVFSDFDSQFEMKLDDEKVLEDGNHILKDIREQKREIINKFLSSSKEKIAFMPSNKDTLKLTLTNNDGYSYSSSAELGELDEKFNKFIVEQLSEYLIKNGIKQIEIFTLTPTKASNVPLPDDILNNIGNGSD